MTWHGHINEHQLAPVHIDNINTLLCLSSFRSDLSKCPPCIVDCGCAMANKHPQSPQLAAAQLVPQHDSTTRIFSSIADRYPGLSGSLVLARIEQDFLANPRQRLTRVRFFSSTGERLLFRDLDSNNRRQDIVVADYARRILAEGMMVSFRGVPLARKSSQSPVEGMHKTFEPYENERASRSTHLNQMRDKAIE